jgi:hypothetical protein
MQRGQRGRATPQAHNPAPNKVIERKIRTTVHLQSTDHELSDLADLQMEANPQDVHAEIERLQESESAKGQV